MQIASLSSEVILPSILYFMYISLPIEEPKRKHFTFVYIIKPARGINGTRDIKGKIQGFGGRNDKV